MRERTFFLDESNIRRLLVTIGLFGLTVFLALHGVQRNQPVAAFLLALVGAACWMLSRPARIFLMVLLLDRTAFAIPGLPNALAPARMVQFMMFGWVLLDAALVKEKRPHSFVTKADGWMVVFLLNIFMIMAVRGFGFRRLGGFDYGGTYYIALLAAILFYFGACRLRFTERDVRALIWVMLIAALFQSVLQIAMNIAPGVFSGIGRFFRIRADLAAMEGQEVTETTVIRWTAFSGLAYALIPVAYLFCKNKVLRAGLLLGAMGLVAMSGFRNNFFRAGSMFFFCSLLFSENRKKTFFLWCVAGGLIYLFLIVGGTLMPPAVQRSISFLPFVHVNPEIARFAQSSTDFRLDLWRQYCIPNVPNYLWIGRGASTDVREFAWLTARWYGSLAFYYHMGSYHSGPFSLLLDYGLAGFVSFTLFFMVVLVDSWRIYVRYAQHQTTLSARYFGFLTVWMTYEVIAYYLIFGAVLSNLFRMLMIAAQLRVIRKDFLVGEGRGLKVEG